MFVCRNFNTDIEKLGLLQINKIAVNNNIMISFNLILVLLY